MSRAGNHPGVTDERVESRSLSCETLESRHSQTARLSSGWGQCPRGGAKVAFFIAGALVSSDVVSRRHRARRMDIESSDAVGAAQVLLRALRAVGAAIDEKRQHTHRLAACEAGPAHIGSGWACRRFSPIALPPAR